MSRKTIDVDSLRVATNTALAHPDTFGIGTADYRRGIASLMEHALHTTGNYRGYRYLSEDEVPRGALPGIVRSDDGNTFPDDSRRFYF